MVTVDKCYIFIHFPHPIGICGNLTEFPGQKNCQKVLILAFGLSHQVVFFATSVTFLLQEHEKSTWKLHTKIYDTELHTLTYQIFEKKSNLTLKMTVLGCFLLQVGVFCYKNVQNRPGNSTQRYMIPSYIRSHIKFSRKRQI